MIYQKKNMYYIYRNVDPIAWLRNNKCILEIKNKDEKCFARAVSLAIAHKRKDDSTEAMNHYKYLRDNREPYAGNDADLILCRAGMSSHTGPCGRDQWMQVERSFNKRYRIVVYCQEYCRNRYYVGPNDAKETLNLFLHDSHFAVITSMSGFAMRSYYCEDCNKGFNNKDAHVCKNSCRHCMQNGVCIADGTRRICTDCRYWFKSQKCFDQHKSRYYRSNGESKRTSMNAICTTRIRCMICKRVKRDDKHKCFTWECNACHKIIENDANHQFKCYMQPTESKKDDSGNDMKFEHSFIFYDFEACQNHELDRDKNNLPIYKHEVNFCIAHKVCDICKDDKEIW